MKLKPETIVCVGAFVKREDSLLAVRQSKGHSLAGQWTIPWGRLEEGESPTAAALREVQEEANVIASVEGLLGLQELPSPWNGWFAVFYLCDHVSGSPRPDDRETDAADYFSLQQLDALDEPFEPWSEWLMRKVLEGNPISIPSNSSNPYHPSVGFV